jgi:hypothetical protein
MVNYEGRVRQEFCYFSLFPQKCLTETVGSRRIDELGIASLRVTFRLEYVQLISHLTNHYVVHVILTQ